MKKAVALALIFFMLFAINLTVLGEEEYGAALNIEYEVNSSNNIVVTASLRDIKVENGISLSEYDIFYEEKDLKLVNVNVNVPDEWLASVSSVDDVNFSHQKSDGYYIWSLASEKPMLGVKEDDQISISLEFEPLTKKETEIKFDYVLVTSDYEKIVNGKVMYDFAPVYTNAANINIDLDDVTTPEIDVSIEVSSTDLLPSPSQTSNTISETSDVQNGNSLNGFVSMPNVNNSDVNQDDSSSFNSTWIIVITIVMVVLVAVVVLVILLKQDTKGNKNV